MRPLPSPTRSAQLPKNGFVSVARACEILNLSGVGFNAYVHSGKLTPRSMPNVPGEEFIDVAEIRAILDAQPPAYLGRGPYKRLRR